MKPSFQNQSASSNHPSLTRRRGLDSELMEADHKKEVDIGHGAYRSGMKHLTASLNQMKNDVPFRSGDHHKIAISPLLLPGLQPYVLNRILNPIIDCPSNKQKMKMKLSMIC